MKIYFSASTCSFYDSAIHGGTMPADVVEISEKQRAELLAGEAEGMVISSNATGYPILENKPAPTADQVAAAVTAVRSAAYIREADPIFFKAQRGEATMDEWLAKVAEIKARFPDGVMPS